MCRRKGVRKLIMRGCLRVILEKKKKRYLINFKIILFNGKKWMILEILLKLGIW